MIGVFEKFIKWINGESVAELNELFNTMEKLSETIIKTQNDLISHEYNDEEKMQKMIEIENKVTELDCTVEKIGYIIKSNKYKPRKYNKNPWYKYYCNCVDELRVITWKYIADYYSRKQNYYMKRCIELIDEVQVYSESVRNMKIKLDEYGNKIEQLEIEKEEFVSYPESITKNIVEPKSFDYLKHIVYLIQCKLVIAEKVSEFDFNVHDAVYYNRCLCIRSHVFRTMFSDVWPEKTADEIIETLKNHHEGKAILKLTSDRDTILIPYITRKYGPEHYFYGIYINSYEHIY